MLVHDIASHEQGRRCIHEQGQVIGHKIEHQAPINSYYLQLNDKAHRVQEEENNFEEYIGMPIEVQFDKNIGLKKNTVDTGLGLQRSS